jgi:hypothetical protein
MKHNSTNKKEDVMNKKHMVLAALMVGATISLSQAQSFYPVLKDYSPAKKELVDKVFSASLGSGHNGLIESSLTIITKMKLDLPADEFPMIKNEINNLMVNGSTPVIRYKAYLAAAVFANPAMFKGEAAHPYSNPEAFFSELAERMTKTLLSSI